MIMKGNANEIYEMLAFAGFFIDGNLLSTMHTFASLDEVD